jgi:surfactin synthase thioesterase subunit
VTVVPLLSRVSPASDAPRLLCLHHAGGNGSFFAEWARELTDTCEVWSVNLPGRRLRYREQAITDPTALVQELADAVQGLQDRPLAIFGHSMGALLGFEVARELRHRASPPPCALIVSACQAPHIRGVRAPIPRGAPELIEFLRSWGGTPPQLLQDHEFLGLALETLGTDLTLCDAYRYLSEPALDVPLTALAGAQDDTAPEDDVTAWSIHTTRWRGIRVLPGGHFYLVQARRLVLDIVARAVKDAVRLADQSGQSTSAQSAVS